MEQHVFDDCIGNPPFEEALKILGDVGGGELTEGQSKFFDMKRKIVDTLQEGATDNEKKLAGIAKLFINYSENMQTHSRPHRKKSHRRRRHRRFRQHNRRAQADSC